LVCDIKFFRERVCRFGVADFGGFRHIDVAFWFQLTVLATALFLRVLPEILTLFAAMSTTVSHLTTDNFPFVTVVVPIRNEADFIAECLQSILNNKYPREKLEVIVVDGLSNDGTREIVQQLIASDPRVSMLDNPERIVPYAMNRAIDAARGEIITRVDGHADVAEDFIANSVRVLQERPDCWCAGGSIDSISYTQVGQIIAACMSTPVGVGNAHFRLRDYEGYVDTIAFGSYWRWVFDRIGKFDEELVRNQDDELNARLIMNGGRIFMSRSIQCRYYPRTSLQKLWRQYYQYGFWRIRTIQKLGRPATLRQMVPMLFVIGLLVLTLAAIVLPIARMALSLYAGMYLSVIGLGSIQVGRRTGLRGLILAPVVFMILHFGYGLGCLWGIVRFVILKRGKISQQMSR
jgi:glycosyltransferase involved in cell wall biosynthesis